MSIQHNTFDGSVRTHMHLHDDIAGHSFLSLSSPSIGNLDLASGPWDELCSLCLTDHMSAARYTCSTLTHTYVPSLSHFLESIGPLIH